MACLTLASATLVGAQTLQTLVSFNGTNGAWPVASLTLGNNGNFYGTTASGGNINLNNGNGCGTVFQITTNGALTTLFSFNGANGEGPFASLTLGNDGNFYGTTYGGGNINLNNGNGYGTVFRVTTNGALTTLFSFSSTDGQNPVAALTFGNDGNLYGTTQIGGRGYGTVFQITTSGTLNKLDSFLGFNEENYPCAALTLGNDGNFYGTTAEGGNGWGDDNPGDGIVFQMTTNGTLTTLNWFNGTDGDFPAAALTLGNDGNFYGTTEYGGGGYGTVFKMTPHGMLTTLTLLSATLTNGANPEAALMLGSDGNFYGTTFYGGIANSANTFGCGTVFRVTTNGALTTLFSFNGTNGAGPAALTLGNDGNFYGTTDGGGNINLNNGGGYGTVFRLLLPPNITVQPHSQTTNAGMTVTFLVSATSLNTISYQWQKNGTNLVNGGNISGAITNKLIITGISDSDAASYSVIVSNANFGVTSSNATLTVIDPPTLGLQFSSGYLQLNLAGMLSNNFVVQYSTNLAGTNWMNLLSLTNLPSSPFLFLDPAGIVPPTRFYRAIMLP